ncbi:Fur family transcriptional regulator [Bacillus carboniphilus]|uniref:Fur family transcriptional regulator n=1 Tax=Bacillus carboniphilus TaxID=86663 RepID=A0ABY9JX47_9BACI|nr:Fur family transcriptional regulator [Bacillus carboniphilus]WLR43961.1 Fur family transcriptional regulator [Bacillus carboniphilus]
MNVKDALQLLKENGHKYTEKREQMLELFAKSDRYLSAKEVLDHLKTDYPNLSFDTIYRNLTTFASLGILEYTELSGEKNYRFKCKIGEHHHHFICMNCGKTKEIEGCPLDIMTKKLDGYNIDGHKFEIYGKCPSCS